MLRSDQVTFFNIPEGMLSSDEVPIHQMLEKVTWSRLNM